MTPLIAQINPVGTSLLEAIGKSGTQAGSNPQAGSESDPPETSGKSGPEGSVASETASPQDSPSGSPPVSPPPQASAPQDSPSGPPPELPTLPTPPQQQY